MSILFKVMEGVVCQYPSREILLFQIKETVAAELALSLFLNFSLDATENFAIIIPKHGGSNSTYPRGQRQKEDSESHDAGGQLCQHCLLAFPLIILLSEFTISFHQKHFLLKQLACSFECIWKHKIYVIYLLFMILIFLLKYFN